MTVSINKERLIAQLKKDEGFSPRAFWDIKQFTYGFGCKALGKDSTITEAVATKKLVVRIGQSIHEFNEVFKGHEDKFNDVRAEVFINILFNIGRGNKSQPELGGLYSFKNTLGLIFNNKVVPWEAVARNLSFSKWDKQVGKRADRLQQELVSGTKCLLQ